MREVGVQTISNDRVNWWLNVAKSIGVKSHDDETKVGAILVHNVSGAIIATGYNGFVRGAPDHMLPKSRPDKYEYMLHAEENMIFNCARHGISMDNCIVVVSTSPCVNCVRRLWQCGIKRVYSKTVYKDISNVRQMKDVMLSIKGVTDGQNIQYYEIEYSKYSERDKVQVPS